MEIDSYRSYIRVFGKTTKIKGQKTEVVDINKFCHHRNLDFGHKKYCGICNKIYWRYLQRMREGLKKVDKKL
ncbi:MAG: hypothetical protein AABW61_00780 [Candidatus Aenigmatarchaeota archaeon]